MVPIRAWLVNLGKLANIFCIWKFAYGEVVSKGRARRDRTLRALCNAVHVTCTVLIQSMEMDGGRLISKTILHVDDESVANINFDAWNWPLPIDANNRSRMLAIWVPCDPADIKVVFFGGSAGKRNEKNVQRIQKIG